MKPETQVQHTPTPWKVICEKNEGTADPLDKTILVTDIGGALIADINENELDARGIDNAAFIVRAVNAHEELLASCKEMLKWWSIERQIHNEPEKSLEKRAVQAIAKAEGK